MWPLQDKFTLMLHSPLLPKGPRLGAQCFCRQGSFSGDVAVGVHHLSDAKADCIFKAIRDMEFYDHCVARYEPGCEAAPSLHVAVVKPANVFGVIRTPDKQLGALGDLEFRE